MSVFPEKHIDFGILNLLSPLILGSLLQNTSVIGFIQEICKDEKNKKERNGRCPITITYTYLMHYLIEVYLLHA